MTDTIINDLIVCSKSGSCEGCSLDGTSKCAMILKMRACKLIQDLEINYKSENTKLQEENEELRTKIENMKKRFNQFYGYSLRTDTPYRIILKARGSGKTEFMRRVMEKEKNTDMRLQITRETFMQVMEDSGVSDMLLECYEELGTLFETGEYIFRFDPKGMTAIIDKDTLDWECPRVINWFKCFQIGRCLNITGIESVGELREVLDNVKEELSHKIETLIKL